MNECMDDLTTYYELQNLEEIIETVRYHLAQFCANGHSFSFQIWF